MQFLTDVEVHAACRGWVVEIYGPAEHREASTGHEVEMHVEAAQTKWLIDTMWTVLFVSPSPRSPHHGHGAGDSNRQQHHFDGFCLWKI